jgi:2-(1,2-epoxy-1,2-dihydrophenyl)acetyl-CoA isomerase
MTEGIAPGVILTISEGVASVRFNRPDRLNALDLTLAEAFLDAVDRLVADETVRVVILSGEGRAFVAGGDLAHLRAASDRPAAARALIDPVHEGLKRMRRAGVLTVVAAQGAVAGAGMSLMLLADFALAAEDTIFSMAYIKVAASPDCGGSWALPRLVGRRRALELMLLSDPLNAREALALGLVTRITPAADLQTEARVLALRLAALPAGAAGRTLDLIDAASGSSLDVQLDRERDAFVAGAGEADFAEALSAFFERRPPRFDPRRAS